MDRKKVGIYGAGETGLFFGELIRQDYPEYEVVAFFDDKKTNHAYSVPILGNGKDIERIREERGVENIVMGFSLPTKHRLKKARRLEERDFKFPSFVPRKIRERYGVEIGKGVLVHPYSEVCPNVKLGDHSMINAFSHIEASEIGEGVLVAPHVFVGAGTKIGEASALYPGARVVAGGYEIGKRVIVGHNAVVQKNLGNRSRYPGRIVGRIERFLRLLRIAS